MMERYTYEKITLHAGEAIQQLAKESRGQLDEDNQSHWDMANGVMRLWLTVAGADARPEDIESLQLLIGDMPGVDDEGEGDWRRSPVQDLSN